MPARMIDGDAIWGSKKLRKVSPHLRWHYLYWLPLAEVNGTFEVDVDQIWATIYGTIFPFVEKEEISQVINEFIRADLLSVWNVDDKTFGFFIGMEKPGRLPSASQQKKYKKLYPDWPGLLETSKQPLGNLLDREGKGREGKEREEEENDMALADKLKNIIYEKTGKDRKLSDYLVSGFRKRAGTEKDKLAQFRDFVSSNPDNEYPLHAFLDTEVEELLVAPVVTGGLVQNPDVLDVAAKVFEHCDLAVSGKSLTALDNLLKNGYKAEEIIQAFKYFYSKLDGFDQKHAVRNFFEKGASESVIKSLGDYQKRQADLQARLEALPITPLKARQTDEDEGEDIF